MGEVTELIDAANSGDAAAAQALFARVYDELKWIARKRIAASPAPTLSTTGLVHEAYLKLAQPRAGDVRSRTHFFALAAKAMRQIVIDRARARMSDKRGGADLCLVELDNAGDVADPQLGPDELLELDGALTELESEEPDLARLVELRFFAGLSMSEIAALQATSERTLARQWRAVKAHLYQSLHPEG